MKLVHQPLGSNLCGQSCVAMVLGLTLKEVKPLFKVWGRTSTKDLVNAIRGFTTRDKRTFHVSNKLVRLKKGKPLPELAICLWRWPGLWCSHWVVWAEGKFWDPEPDGIIGGRMTSYLPIGVEP